MNGLYLAGSREGFLIDGVTSEARIMTRADVAGLLAVSTSLRLNADDKLLIPNPHNTSTASGDNGAYRQHEAAAVTSVAAAIADLGVLGIVNSILNIWLGGSPREKTQT